MTSVLNVDTIAAKDGTSPVGLTKQHAAKAWATVDGSSGTPSLTSSFNCSSNTDLGTGSYATHLTNAMSDGDYPIVANDNERGCGESNNNTSSRVDVIIRNPTNLSAVDATSFFAVHGDLA